MTPINTRNKKLAAKVIKELETRHFEAYYVNTKDEAREKALDLISKEETIAWGGSVTLSEIGLLDVIKNEGYVYINKDNGKSDEENMEFRRQTLLADIFLSSTNALTESGELVNLDGLGNRVAAMIFGPKKVIIIAGINKIVHNLDDAISRTRYTAAPINKERVSTINSYASTTPCLINGACSNCKSKDSICSYLSIIRLCNPPKKIKVIIVGENLGY